MRRLPAIPNRPRFIYTSRGMTPKMYGGLITPQVIRRFIKRRKGRRRRRRR